MSASYTPLDPNIQTVLGQSNQPFGFTIGQETSLFAISSFVLFLFLAASGVATIGRILYALGLKTANSDNEAKITTANKIITSSLFALLMSFSLVLLFLAVNPDVVKGTVDFSKITVTSMAAGSQTQVSTGSTGSSSCPDETAFKNNVLANKGVCMTNTCEALSGCDTTTYASIINSEASKQGVNPKIVTTLMCRESKGKKDATHTNTGNSIDCGLMQINKNGATACSPSDLDPQTNIAAGVALIKAKYASISQSYPGITTDMMVFASYNCCNTGNPNSQSANCNPSSGYPFTLPKWACPINPGQTTTNMCFVRNYVCDVVACLSRL